MTINLQTGLNDLKIYPERFDGMEYVLKLVHVQSNDAATCVCDVSAEWNYIAIQLEVTETPTTERNKIHLRRTGEYIYSLTSTANNLVCKVGRAVLNAQNEPKKQYERNSNNKIVYGK